MPIATKCPGCKALFRLADELAGKKVRCQKCAQLFAVPMPKAAAPVAPPAPAPPPAPAAPAPLPPISLSLDDPPFMATVQPPPPAQDTILDAILVENATPAEVIDATLVEAPMPAEVIDATLVEPPQAAPAALDATLVDETPAPPPRGRRRPDDDDASNRRKPARPRRSGDLPRHSSVASGAIAFLVFLLLAALIIGAFAGTWAVLNMGKGKKMAVMPPQQPKINFKNEDKVFVDKDKDKKGEFFNQLPFDLNGKATAAGNVPPDNAFVYRVFLQQNQPYNLLVVGTGFLPSVRIQGVGAVAARDGDSRILLSFTPALTGEHTIRVANLDQFQAGNFTLSFAPADNAPPTQINLAGKANFKTERTLRLEDPVNENFHYGPCHKYLLNVKPGEKYQFKVTPTGFQPVLRLQNGGILLQQKLVHAIRDLDYTYTVPPPVGVLAIHVSSEFTLFGKYTLAVTRLSEEDKPGPRTVVFASERYQRDDRLTPQDPQNDQGHIKTYLIAMEKGMGYNIEMKSKEIDPFLCLFDPQGKLVAKDDDSAGDLNARILFDPKVAGTYSLLASDFKKGTGAYNLDITRVKLPASTAVNQPLVTLKRQEAGCDLVQADLGRSPATAHTFSWAPDGKAFFLLDREGMLRRIRYPDFVEEQRLFVAKDAPQIHLSAEGLLASLQGAREIWVLDPQDLQLKRRLPRIGTHPLITAPSLSYAYANSLFNKADGTKVNGLVRHDLTRSEIFGLGECPGVTQFYAVTPDGRFVVGRDQDSFMVRWRVQNDKAVRDEQGTRYFRTWAGLNPPLITSADGKVLLHPINNKLFPKDGIQPGPASGSGVAAYRINDLSKPAFVFDSNGPFAGTAIDPKTGLLCIHTKTKGFVFVDPQGKMVRELAINTQAPITRLAFHPDGGKLLAFFGTIAAPKVLSIELPKDLLDVNENK